MNKIIKIILSSLIVIFAIPAVSLGSSLTLSLINGKTPEESVGILATQIDSVLDRLGVVEEKQISQENIIQEQGQAIASTSLELASTSLVIKQNLSEQQAKLSQQQTLIDEQVASLEKIKNDIIIEKRNTENNKECEKKDNMIEIAKENSGINDKDMTSWEQLTEYINKQMTPKIVVLKDKIFLIKVATSTIVYWSDKLKMTTDLKQEYDTLCQP